MTDRLIKDNRYEEGSIILAKANPKVNLLIIEYLQRIYYCVEVNHPQQKQLVYFERELVSPTQLSQSRQFTPIEKILLVEGNLKVI
jgi:hypothetical protein